MEDREQIVILQQYIPGILVELRYATEQNFTGKVIYDFSEACLRKGTADKLRRSSRFCRNRAWG